MLLPPAGLMESLAVHFKIRSLLLAMAATTELRDEDLQSVLNCGANGWSASVVAWNDLSRVLDRFDQDDGGSVLIVAERLGAGAVARRHLGSRFVWLLPEESVISLPGLRFDSNLLSWAEESADGGGGGASVVTVLERYAVKGRPVLGVLARFLPSVGLRVPSPFAWRRRADLGGVTLVVTVAPYHPILTVSADGEHVDGFFPQLLKMLQDRLNFRIKTVFPADGQWGTANGSRWSGMVGQLTRGEADVCAAGMTLTRARADAIDFTVATLEDLASLTVAARPRTRHFQLGMFVKEFQPRVWVALVSTIILAAAAAAAVAVCTSSSKADAADAFGGFLSLTIHKDGVGGVVGVGAASVRLLRLSLSLGCFVLWTLYVARLTADLTAGADLGHPRSFADVLRMGLTVYTSRGTIFEHFLRSAPADSDLGRVFRRSAVILDEPDTALLGAMAEDRHNVALFVWSFMAVGRKHLVHLTDFQGAYKLQIGLALQKDSELKGLLDYHILRLRETGAVEVLRRQWLDPEGRQGEWTNRVFVEEAVPVAGANVMIPMAILLAGIAGAVLMSLLECVLARH